MSRPINLIFSTGDVYSGVFTLGGLRLPLPFSMKFLGVLLLINLSNLLVNFYEYGIYILEIALTRNIFSTKNAPKKRLAAGLRPDRLGELTALPQTP